MTKTKNTFSFNKKFAFRFGCLLCAALLIVVTPLSVSADRFDDQIDELKKEIGNYESQASSLRAQADTLQNALNIITNEKNALQRQIELNEAKHQRLVVDIAANEAKLERQKGVVGKTIARIYVNGNTTPIEMLASSKNVGQYVSAQEVRSSIRNQMKSAMDQVKKLKKELDKQRTDLERILADQAQQREALSAKEAEQARLVEQTRGEEAAYQNMIAEKRSQIDELYAQQQRSLKNAGGVILSSGSSGGGYPDNLAYAPLDSIVDPWGMYNRECVSYAAWRVYHKNGYMPYWGGVGNARQWPGNADAAGISRGKMPKVGSVAVIYSVYAGDPYGHVAWVESVESGMVTVSQYNWGSPGSYSTMRVNASYFDTYIYF